ncbi:MAG: cytochrome c [Chitinispirillaceae bacterium]|nr:cytochrome c [Chitinispirillaceae bacterium]
MFRKLKFIGCGLACTLVILTCDPKREITPDDDVDRDTTITYSAHIAPLLQSHCGSCHIDGIVQGGADFSTYANVTSLIDRIIFRTGSGTMPPAGGGTPLSNSQVDTLKIWKVSGVRQ